MAMPTEVQWQNICHLLCDVLEHGFGMLEIQVQDHQITHVWEKKGFDKAYVTTKEEAK